MYLIIKSAFYPLLLPGVDLVALWNCYHHLGVWVKGTPAILSLDLMLRNERIIQTPISVLVMLFLCLLLGHPRDNCVDLRLGSVHLPVATNKEPPWLIKSSLRNFNPKAANSERNFNLIHTNALKKLYLTKRQTKSSNLDQTTSLTGLTTEGDRLTLK